MGVATIRIMVSLPLVVIVLSCAIGISMHTVTVCLLPLDDEVLHTRLATDRAFTKAYFTCFAERSFRSLENRGTVTGHLTALDWGLNSTVMGRKENLPLDRQRKHCNAARLALRESRKPKLVQDKLICWDQDHGSPLLLAAKCFLVFVVCKPVACVGTHVAGACTTSNRCVCIPVACVGTHVAVLCRPVAVACTASNGWVCMHVAHVCTPVAVPCTHVAVACTTSNRCVSIPVACVCTHVAVPCTHVA